MWWFRIFLASYWVEESGIMLYQNERRDLDLQDLLSKLYTKLHKIKNDWAANKKDMDQERAKITLICRWKLHPIKICC